MERRGSEFNTFHPLANFIFFLAVIGFSMFCREPLLQLISMAGAFLYSIILKGKRAAVFNLGVILPVMILTAVINPLFNHEGITVLAYFSNGNPLTLESLLYGASAGLMLGEVICWFSTFNEVMTADKLMHLSGRVFPALSLIFSMTLRFMPRFKTRLSAVMVAQRGLITKNEGMMGKLKRGITVLSCMVTWSLESSVEMADSMKSRGYGLKNRTAYSDFILDKRDVLLITAVFLIAGVIIWELAAGIIEFKYFPVLKWSQPTALSVLGVVLYTMLCLMPALVELWEGRRWR